MNMCRAFDHTPSRKIRSPSGLISCRIFSRGIIFTRARVSLALQSLRKNGGLLVVYKKTKSCDQVGVPDLKVNGSLTSDPFCKAKH